MHMRRIRFSLFAAFVLLAGCRVAKSTESAPPDQPPALPVSAQTVAHIHWLGIKQISGKANAAHLMAIWNLPESRQLERQTLDKLSLAPWPLLHRNVDTNAATLLRPLLDDLVADESCLEIRQTTNQPGELVLAIRLDDQRAALWQTSLARVLESLTGIHPVPAPEPGYGWSLKKHHDPNFLELTRVGGWTIVGAAQDHNGLLGDLLTRIRQGQPPLPVGPTNDWLAADLNLSRVFLAGVGTSRCDVPAREIAGGTGAPLDTVRTAQRAVPTRSEGAMCDFVFPGILIPSITNLCHLHLTVTGESSNVVTRGTLEFSRPLDLTLPPWNIPTNLIDEQLASFTLIRGFKPWLESSPAWNNLQIGPPPDQVCFWALQNLPMQSYFAAPFPGASNAVDRLTDLVLQSGDPWFATNGLAKFVRSEVFNGLEWRGVPLMSPFLRSMTFDGQSFVYGGGFPDANVHPLSEKILQKDLNRPNLVYHDWEATGLRAEQWFFMGQLIRLVSHKAQLSFHAPATLWLKALPPELGDSVTDVTKTGPNQLSFVRKSSLGFTAVELNLLTDWLESPNLPMGLHTLLAPTDDSGDSQALPAGPAGW
jgi:hypothetical protein